MKTERKFDIAISGQVHENLVQALTNALTPNLDAQSDKDCEFKRKWQLQNLLSKYTEVDKSSAKVRREAAIAKFLSMDERNRATNNRLLFDQTSFGLVRFSKIVEFAQKVIVQTIGVAPPLNVVAGGFSNGASTRVKSGGPAISVKYTGKAHITQEALPHFQAVLGDCPVWVSTMFTDGFRPSVVEGSMLFTVPKNSDIDRVACKEPELNMYMQRGVGNYIRKALLRRKINLNDQSVNRRLAREGSSGRKLATLDLSSASDLISTELVRLLLPKAWFDVMNDIRVKRTLIGDVWHELNMFSSMGNGFTFELESLLFYALSCAINRTWKIRGRISVYGDDIITPSSIAPMYGRVFAWCGFKVNTKKSFWRGSFRESCGGHYYNGCDVTPFYIRKRIDNLLDLNLCLNNLRRWATDNDLHMDLYDPIFREVWSTFSKYIPRQFKGGRDIADKGALVTDDYPSKRLIPVLRKKPSPQLGAYLQWLQAHADRRESVAMCSGTVPCNSINNWVTLRWLDVLVGDESIPTSSHVVELGVKPARNRTWNRSLDPQLLWIQELVG